MLNPGKFRAEMEEIYLLLIATIINFILEKKAFSKELEQFSGPVHPFPRFEEGKLTCFYIFEKSTAFVSIFACKYPKEPFCYSFGLF